MKTLLFVILIFKVFAATGQKNQVLTLAQKATISYKENLFILCRGTISKARLIGKKFNIKDSNITHIGLGFFEENEFKIFNVTDNSITKDGSHLVIDSIASFLKSGDIYYFSIWKCDIPKKRMTAIKKICKQYSNRKIYFDATFRLNDDDTLYCSEFCALVLNRLNIEKLRFAPKQYVLNNSFYETVLGTKILVYFPVDFFETNNLFKRIYECWF
jgi:hypothetical protein